MLTVIAVPAYENILTAGKIIVYLCLTYYLHNIYGWSQRWSHIKVLHIGSCTCVLLNGHRDSVQHPRIEIISMDVDVTLLYV